MYLSAQIGADGKLSKNDKVGELARMLIPWSNAEDPALELALRELDWYTKRRVESRRYYQASEGFLLLAGAGTTVAAALAAPPFFTATLAAATVFLTGFRQTFDPHGRWIACALAWNRTREAIWEYKFGGSTELGKVELIARMKEISSEESGRWLAAQQARRSRRDESALRSESASPSKRGAST